jgi:hypothetical protein
MNRPKIVLTRLFFLPFLVMAFGCADCDGDMANEDAGQSGSIGDVDSGSIRMADGGLSDAGEISDSGSGFSQDGGLTVSADSGTGQNEEDGGDSFSWNDLFGDAGLPPELDCLPGGLPEFSVAGFFDLLAFHSYTGSSENGVICGDQTCSPGIPCCELCGYATCADPGVDGGLPSCPAFTRSIWCDGAEDCPNSADADTCCYTLEGTDCRAESECVFDLSLDAGLPFSFGDGGWMLPNSLLGDAGESNPIGDGGVTDAAIVDFDSGVLDSGSIDGGFADAGIGSESDGGITNAVDAGLIDSGPIADGGVSADAGLSGPVDAGGQSMADAGEVDWSFLEEVFAQGVPVCRNTFFDCNVFQGEMCCTSDRFVAIELGLCMPALMCLGGEFP